MPQWTVNPDDAGLRLDKFLAAAERAGSRARAAEALERADYELDVIDLTRHPSLAAAAQIVAAPTLVKQSPAPLRRFVGDMSDTERLMRALNIKQPRVAHGT